MTNQDQDRLSVIKDSCALRSAVCISKIISNDLARCVYQQIIIGTNANARRRWTVNDYRSPWMTPGDSRDASGSLFVWPMPVVVPSRLSASSPPPRPVSWGLIGPTPAARPPTSIFSLSERSPFCFSSFTTRKRMASLSFDAIL